MMPQPVALGYLPRETIDALHATAIERGLYVREEQQSLLGGIPHAIVASIPDASTPFLRLRSTLRFLNAAAPAPGEPAPLAVWLDNAATALADFDEAKVFTSAKKALVRALGSAPAEDGRLPHPPAEIDAAPPSEGPGDDHSGARLGDLYVERDGAAGEARVAIERRIARLHHGLRAGGVLDVGDFLADGRFQLISVLGRGGFGTVWKALDRREGDHAAVKVLHAELRTDEDARRGFFRGARHMARLRHPNIVRIRLMSGAEELGAHVFTYFIAMDYLPGGTLKDAVTGGRIGPDRAVGLLGQIAGALQHVHERGIVHCDVSPDNVLLTKDLDTAKLSDFDLLAADHTTVTRDAGGKPAFIAPEVARGERPTARSDVYALAMTVIFALYGKPLPAADVLADPRGFVKRLPCREGERRVLLHATRRDPAERYPSADAFWSAYLATVSGDGTTAKLQEWLRRLSFERRLALAAAIAATAGLGGAMRSSVMGGEPTGTGGAPPSTTISSSSASSTPSTATSASSAASTSSSTSSTSSSSTSSSSTSTSGKPQQTTKPCRDPYGNPCPPN